MKARYALALALCLSMPARAEESCGLRAARLLSAGQSEELSALFAGQPGLTQALKQLADRAGALTELQEARSPRFKLHQRLSVGQAAGPYQGSWVNARSERLGEIQLHIAQQPGGSCALLALHLDYAT